MSDMNSESCIREGFACMGVFHKPTFFLRHIIYQYTYASNADIITQSILK